MLDVPAALRLTARIALVFFSLAFSARAMSQLFGVKWLLRHRRALGVAFGVTMFVHLGAIAVLAVETGPRRFLAGLSAGTYLGILGYLTIAAMVATSTDRTAAWLGRRRWKILHTSGMYGLGGFFLLTYAGAVVKRPEPLTLALAAVALTPWALRLAGFVISRRRSRQ